MAAFILNHYNTIHKDSEKPPLLFLVGDKRRDIIPRSLQSQELGVAVRCVVEELEIYETGEMQTWIDVCLGCVGNALSRDLCSMTVCR